MTENNPSVNIRITTIECQIQEAILETEEIIRKKVAIRDEAGLEAIENEIVRAADRLAGLITDQKIQQAPDSEYLKQEASGLIKAHPKKMKNRGPRDAEVRPLQKGWKSSDKKNWVKKYRKLLIKGKTDEVIEAIHHLCKRRRIKNLRRELNCFIRNQKRMCYDKLRKRDCLSEAERWKVPFGG